MDQSKTAVRVPAAGRELSDFFRTLGTLASGGSFQRPVTISLSNWFAGGRRTASRPLTKHVLKRICGVEPSDPFPGHRERVRKSSPVRYRICPTWS